MLWYEEKNCDNIIISSKETGKTYISEIINFSKDSVICKIINLEDESVESNVNIDLYQGLPKSDKMEFIIQKTTELGVKSIFPVDMERCVVKIDKKSELKKLERWQKISEVAAKQSKRDIIPKVENIIKLILILALLKINLVIILNQLFLKREAVLLMD